MLYHVLPGLSDVHMVFNVFRYLTFRAAGAVVTSLLIAFVFGPMVIRRLRRANVGQVVRDVGPAAHLAKAGTPTMGGVLIILAASVSTLLWADLTNVYIRIALVALLWMGAIGFLDDYLKVVQGKTKGLIARYKMVGQWTFGLGLGAFLILNPISPHPSTATSVPFFSDVQANFIPFAFVLFSGFVVSGTSNAVNFTDGLDGLAAGVAAIIAATLAFLAAQAGEIFGACVGVAMVGALLGFLPFNFSPARIFLGDTGALFIGYVLALLALEGYRQLTILTFVVPVFALAVPILDTTLSVIRRLRARSRIFDADRLHMHHRMLESEGSARSAVLQVYILTAAFCSISLAFSNLAGYMALLFLVAVGILTYRLITNLGALAAVVDPAASRESSLNSGDNEP